MVFLRYEKENIFVDIRIRLGDEWKGYSDQMRISLLISR